MNRLRPGAPRGRFASQLLALVLLLIGVVLLIREATAGLSQDRGLGRGSALDVRARQH